MFLADALRPILYRPLSYSGATSTSEGLPRGTSYYNLRVVSGKCRPQASGLLHNPASIAAMTQFHCQCMLVIQGLVLIEILKQAL